MLCPGTINYLCFALTFIITLKYFKCDTSTFIYTNKFNQYLSLSFSFYITHSHFQQKVCVDLISFSYKSFAKAWTVKLLELSIGSPKLSHELIKDHKNICTTLGVILGSAPVIQIFKSCIKYIIFSLECNFSSFFELQSDCLNGPP